MNEVKSPPFLDRPTQTLNIQSVLTHFPSTTLQQWSIACRFYTLLAQIPNGHALFTDIDPSRLKNWEFSLRTFLQMIPLWFVRLHAIHRLMQSFPDIQEQTGSLESQFQKAVTTIDFSQSRDFADFLVPNEKNPLAIQPHLAMSKRGLLVSTGTERCFFDLALIDPTKCQGLVVRDISIKVKAYVDFNILLLRISKNMAHYAQLSTIDSDTWDDAKCLAKIAEIKTLLLTADIPPILKQYYLNNLIINGRIYFSTRHREDWRKDRRFDGVAYHQVEHLFYQLQRYAKCGNIIATLGDIGDLQFLDKKQIAILDMSNIPDYKIVKFYIKSIPTIIITRPVPGKVEWSYESFVYCPPTEEEADKLSDLLGDSSTSRQIMVERIKRLVPIGSHIPRYYSAELLRHLEQ